MKQLSVRFDVLRKALLREDFPNSTHIIKTKDTIISDSFFNPIVELLSEMVFK